MEKYHPILDRTIDVPESTARALAASGWVDPPTTTTSTTLEATDGFEDTTTSANRAEDSE